MMLTFQNTEEEARFWGRLKAGPLRVMEMVALVVSFATALAVDVLAYLPGSDSGSAASLGLPVSLHSLSMAFALYLAWAERPVYEKYHDWLMALLRLSSFPSLLHEEPCWSTQFKEKGNGLQVLLTVSSAVVVFRPIRAFCDGLRFPLRFRHHLVMQLVLLGLSSKWNWHACGTCFQGEGEQVSEGAGWTLKGKGGGGGINMPGLARLMKDLGSCSLQIEFFSKAFGASRTLHCTLGVQGLGGVYAGFGKC